MPELGRKQLRTVGRKLEDLRKQVSVIKDELALVERQLDTLKTSSPAPHTWASPPVTRLAEVISSWDG